MGGRHVSGKLCDESLCPDDINSLHKTYDRSNARINFSNLICPQEMVPQGSSMYVHTRKLLLYFLLAVTCCTPTPLPAAPSTTNCTLHAHHRHYSTYSWQPVNTQTTTFTASSAVSCYVRDAGEVQVGMVSDAPLVEFSGRRSATVNEGTVSTPRTDHGFPVDDLQ